MKKTKRSKRKMRKTMRIRGGSSIFGSTAPAEPVAGAGPEPAAGPATEPAAQAEQQGVTKEQAIECAKTVLMFLENS